MITSGFFNSVGGDRKYKAEFFAKYFASFIGNGVFPNPSNNLQVIANNDMTVTVKAGKAWIDGYILFNDDDYILNIEPADGVLNRIDRVVLRLDKLDREIQLVVKKGVSASSPTARNLQRDADAYELGIADVYVGTGVVGITQANITDTRLDTELCGIVHGVVDQVDTTTIFNQYQAWFNSITGGTEQEIADWQQQQYDDFMIWFQSIQDILEGDVAANLASRISSLENDFTSHLADYANFKNNIEAIDYNEDKLFLKINGEWVEHKSSEGYPVGNITNFEAKGDDTTVELTWQDPPNVTITDSLGNLITIARWKGTKILRKPKVHGYPQNENDGILVVDNGVRNQYETVGFVDTGLVNDTDYCYMAFPYTEEDVFTVDEANRVIGTPSDVDDKTGSPGSAKLIAGTMTAGFFGVVPASELFTGAEISSACGITQGTLQFSDVGWLKFAIDGEIIFKSQKTYRHSISYDHINSKGCVHGETQASKNGINYKATLLKGALTDPSVDVGGDRGAKGSEWNRLMLPIHIKAKDKSWAYPAYVEDTIPYWGIDFTDSDLQTTSGAGNGSYHWCQEVYGPDASYRVSRGYFGVSHSNNNTSSNTNSHIGWSPVLRVIA